MPDKLVQQEYSELVTKILLPAFITVAVGVAVEMKNNRSKVSMLSAVLSFVIGVGGAYIVSGVLQEYFKGGWYTVFLCTATLLSEKTIKYIINEFKFDLFLTAIAEYAYQKLKSLLK